jgi:hypothetical protein
MACSYLVHQKKRQILPLLIYLSAYHKKLPDSLRSRVVLHISRILSEITLRMIIYLGRLLPTTSCGSSSTTLGRNTCSYEPFPPKVVLDAALHTSKDLAVSPSLLPKKLFHKGIPPLSFWASLLAPLVSPRTGVTRYLAPYRNTGVFGLSSPSKDRAIIVPKHYTTNLYLIKSLMGKVSPNKKPNRLACPALVSITYRADIAGRKDSG